MRRVIAGLAVVATVLGACAASVSSSPPAKIVLVGDSITAQYGPTAAAMLRAKGYEVVVYGFPGTGLLDPYWCQGQQARVVAKMHPDLVVWEHVGSYARAGGCGAGERGTEQWYRKWTASARRQQRIVTRDGARFLWWLHPFHTRSEFVTVTPRVNAIYRSLGAVIDGPALVGSDASLTVDGLHLSELGKLRVAQAVVNAVG